MQWIDSFSALAERYDGFLLDLWGVVHDGSHLYPGARESLAQLKAAGKKIVFISNAPRRAFKVQNVLAQLGVAQSDYEAAVSSGEAAYQWLAEKKINPGRRYFYIGPERDADAIDGLDFAQVASPQEADFILNVGFGSEAQGSDAWMPLLKECRARALAMLCLNPDFEVVKISGERFPCAGAIARDYETLGGTVRYFGKPYPEVYELAMARMGGIATEKILAVGDGLHTDIAGANRQGIDCVLVTGGILKQEFGTLGAADVMQPRFQEYCRNNDGSPDFVMLEFRWR